jgi:hypothetical protein
MTYTRIELATVALLSLAACGDSDPADSGKGLPEDASASEVDARASLPMDAGEARASRHPDGGAVPTDAQVGACEPTADCLAVRASLIKLDPCCAESISCGLVYVSGSLSRADFYGPLHLDVGACIPQSTLIFEGKTPVSLRVTLDGGQVLVSDGCPTVFITSVPFRGCCLPSNECALSTDVVHNELGIIADDPGAPFAQAECVPPDELNAQLRASSLAGFAHLPSSNTSCDYVALDSTLPAPSAL